MSDTDLRDIIHELRTTKRFRLETPTPVTRTDFTGSEVDTMNAPTSGHVAQLGAPTSATVPSYSQEPADNSFTHTARNTGFATPMAIDEQGINPIDNIPFDNDTNIVMSPSMHIHLGNSVGLH